MNDLTRREFLNTAAGATIGGVMIGPAGLLKAANAATPSGMGQSMGVDSAGPTTPIEVVIFPKPREIASFGSDFILDKQVTIVVPPNAGEDDLFLARSFANELGDRFDLHLKIERSSNLKPGARAIVMGSIQNPLVRAYSGQGGAAGNHQIPGPEGYVLRTDKNVVLVAGSDTRGAFYGLQSLRQLVFKDNDQVKVRGVRVRDWPEKEFRGLYLFLPGRNNIAFFKRFIRDYMALYKYNTLIMEMGASMRLDSHPELNSGWVEFARECNYSGRNYPPGALHDVEQNSSHQDTADGGFLEKEEVADLARWIAKHQIELIPEIASLTHSYYLLTKYRKLAAVPESEWPDTYCPSNPDSYPLAFDVYDEYIDVLKPKTIHIGHDELFLPVNVSPQCKDENIGELFGQDVKQIHDHLASRGVKTALWGDMLLQSVRGKGLQKHVAPDGWAYSMPGGMTAEQVERLIPKDCLIFNWFWNNDPEDKINKNPELNEAMLDKMGFKQIYGNFEPTIKNYETRKNRRTLLGGAPSAWAATNEFNFGKDLMSIFLGCSSILWSGQVFPGKELSGRVQSMLPAIRARLSGITPPSQTEKLITPVDISSKFNAGDKVEGIDLRGSGEGTVKLSQVPFDLKSANGVHSIVVGTSGKAGGQANNGLANSVAGIPIGAAPTSLIFLHASAKPAANRESFRLIWDPEDTADLLGWYEVVYEDGFVTTIPIRYGVNIAEMDWDQRVAINDYCYGADAVVTGSGTTHPVTFFAFEWINPRLGKVVQEIRLKGTTGFQGASTEFDNAWGPVIENNAVILKAISMVHKRGEKERKG